MITSDTKRKTLRVILWALLLVVVGASTASATHGRPDLQVPIQGGRRRDGAIRQRDGFR
jgi:hypothetical protein